jgi:hypothetical protein
MKPSELIGHWFKNEKAFIPIYSYVVEYFGRDANLDLYDIIEFDEEISGCEFKHQIVGPNSSWVPYTPGNTDLQEAVMAVFE